MTTPVTFTSRSSRFGLPFLFPGQAQKEVYINEAHALVDALLQPVIEGVSDTPPVYPQDGGCWIVGSTPTGAWAGHASEIACYQAGSWLFAPAVNHMRVFDRSSSVYLHFNERWSLPATVTAPSGGSTVDTEARAAITALIQALASGGAIMKG
jgi:hypothetical protein